MSVFVMARATSKNRFKNLIGVLLAPIAFYMLFRWFEHTGLSALYLLRRSASSYSVALRGYLQGGPNSMVEPRRIQIAACAPCCSDLPRQRPTSAIGWICTNSCWRRVSTCSRSTIVVTGEAKVNRAKRGLIRTPNQPTPGCSLAGLPGPTSLLWVNRWAAQLPANWR